MGDMTFARFRDETEFQVNDSTTYLFGEALNPDYLWLFVTLYILNSFQLGKDGSSCRTCQSAILGLCNAR